jgi:guanylate kinase
MNHDENNIMVILSSPSGAGKTTITKKIQQKYQSFKISVSHTTRKPRKNEIDGVDYYFVNHEKFKTLINQEKFYEYAKIFENFYFLIGVLLWLFYLPLMGMIKLQLSHLFYGHLISSLLFLL